MASRLVLVFALFVVFVMVFMAVFADVITVHDPVEISFEYMLVTPSLDFLLGTDQLGRDIFSRIVYGARTALLVGITASVIGAFIGLVLGVASAYFGGTFDLLFQRVMDVFMAFPLIILALASAADLRGGVTPVQKARTPCGSSALPSQSVTLQAGKSAF